MKIKTKSIVRVIIGLSLILVGIVGLFVPLLQGIALILVGLYLVELRPMNRFLRNISRKWKTRKRAKKK